MRVYACVCVSVHVFKHAKDTEAIALMQLSLTQSDIGHYSIHM